MAPRLLCTIPVCLVLFPTDLRAQDAVDLAARLIGRPYVWGAEGPNAFDCSGLTQYVYRQVGVDLPRRAVNQADAGDPAGRRLQRGDLLFFSTDTRRSLVTHVGIYEGNGMMIDASQRHGRVRRDSLDERYWIERFMGARRVTAATRTRKVGGSAPRPSSPGGDKARTTVRVLGQIAEILLRRR